MTAPDRWGGEAPLLTVENLRVTYPGPSGDVAAIRGLSFALRRERLGIVGESGSGKSSAGRAIMGLVHPPGRVAADVLQLGELDLLACRPAEMARLRGRRLAMVLQDPKYSLNPVMRVGAQIAEVHRRHFASAKAEARNAALAMLSSVRINDPEHVYGLYPHQVSGGMGQRVMIAAMLIAGPDVLIADEPTSALDAAVQQQLLSILDDLVASRGMGLILISHNLRLVASFCDRVLVMYGGQVLEECRAGELWQARHPYTRGLLAALPDLEQPRVALPQLQREAGWLDAR